jgi:arginyl-tRNA synthetase
VNDEPLRRVPRLDRVDFAQDRGERTVAGNLDLARFVVEPPRDPAHGDLATNAAMVYAKEARGAFASPRQLATEIAAALANDPSVAEAEVAGPGFINIKPETFSRVLRAALEKKQDFGRPDPAKTLRQKINIEYVSANPKKRTITG